MCERGVRDIRATSGDMMMMMMMTFDFILAAPALSHILIRLTEMVCEMRSSWPYSGLFLIALLPRFAQKSA